MADQKDDPIRRCPTILSWGLSRSLGASWFRFVIIGIMPAIMIWIAFYHIITPSPVEIVVKDHEIDIPAGSEESARTDLHMLSNTLMQIPDYGDFLKRAKRFKKLYYSIDRRAGKIYYFTSNHDKEEPNGFLYVSVLEKPICKWVYYYESNKWNFEKEAKLLTIQYTSKIKEFIIVGMFVMSIFFLIFGGLCADNLHRDNPLHQDPPAPRRFDNPNV